MAEMVPQLEINVGRVYLVVNRLRNDEMPPPLAAAIEKTGLNLIGTVPDDAAMAELEFSGRPLVELPTETTVYQAVQRIARDIL
jgi:CO dehydrogenase maturation factor